MNVGDVFVIRTALSRPPKDKIVLCVCPATPLFFWINSLPRPHGVGQFQLVEADHGALRHDCFLDCSRLTTFPAGELAQKQARGPIRYELSQRIAEFLATNPPKTLPKIHLDLAVQNLG